MVDPLLFDMANEVLRHLLEDSTRERDLNELISRRGHENSNDIDLDRLFDEYIATLPAEEQPTNNRTIGIMFKSWELQRQEELDHWNEELSSLKSETSIETKMCEGCMNRLELAKLGMRVFQGLKTNEIVAKAKGIDKDPMYFLWGFLHDEEGERINFVSHLNQYTEKFGTNPKPTKIVASLRC